MKPIQSLSRRLFLLLFLALAAGSAQAVSIQIKDTVKQKYDVRPGGTLYLDMDHGNIEVEATGGSHVLIELERIAEADDRQQAEELFKRHDYEFNPSGNDVRIRSRYDDDKGFLNRWRSRHRLKIRVLVKVPERYNVDFTSGAGNVDVSGLEGRIEGRTGAGNITLANLRGTVDVSSGAGNIDLAGDVEQVKVHTGAGNVDLNGLTGAVEASTGAGNVTAEITRQPRQASSLSSGAGNVTVRLANRIGVYVEASSALGSADCDFALKVEGKWLKKSFSGEVNGGGPELRLHTGVGNVALKRD